MPAPDSEPEKYSIDDMMDRLRSSGEGGRDGEAELVTREDGTQVYKVRKRKRRSKQPKKEKEKRQKNFRVAQIVMAVGLVALVAVAFFASLVYLNSSAYRESILVKIRKVTGAEPKITQLRLTPVSASAESVELSWPEGSMLDNLKLYTIQGDLNFTSLARGIWKGSEMYSVSGGTLVLRPPSTGSLKSQGLTEDSPFQFRYRSAKFNVRMGSETAPDFQVRNSEAELEMHDPKAVSSHMVLKGGTLNVAKWGDFALDFASFQFEPDGMRVGNIRVSPPGANKGEVEISNPDKVLLGFDGSTTKLQVRAKNMPLTSLLGPAFGTWLSSTVESPENEDPGEMLVRPASEGGITCRIPFRALASAETVAAGLPMFDIMANEMGETWYRLPRFDLESRGSAVLEADRKGLDNLLLSARGRLSISGKVFVDAEGKLDGELNVGLPASGVDGGSIGLRNTFSRKGGGFAWAKVKISGTAKQPLDDLAVQLKSSATSVLPTAGGDESLEQAFDDLTTPPSGQ